ncbi:CarD family transcriptional regulator [Oceanobacillus piezotolerans]|uniref:CarD family transcriptional regulator n=1 Tax=Oceanobacillus piezotolerans TaxID=2448030 RepID=A0A498DA00_9BACI|nr:CarD family transcriptional regulator [Oceanobacillus piezotolerans]RLL45461.1 CarD family transcriptional regulator [Oceanobacillus piezotolerans]
MFNIGDTIIYSVHGLCKIDDICEKPYHGETKTYYVLHPMNDERLTISTPVDNDKVLMLKMMTEEEATIVLESFKDPGIAWIEDVKKRNKNYKQLIKSGDRKEISKVASTLMQREAEAKASNKRLYDQDRKLLTTIQSILFKELATSLDTTYENIENKVHQLVAAANQHSVK